MLPLALWAALWAAPEPQEAPFCTVNGEAVALADFKDWLAASHGWRYRHDYVVLVLFRQEAARAGVTLAPGELDGLFERFFADQVLLRYNGDEELFLADLARGGVDRAGYKQRHLPDIERQELGRRIVLATRSPAEDDLKTLHELLFPGGTRTHLKVAFFDRFKGFAERRSPSEQVLKELDATVRARAEAFAAAARAAPEAFATLTREQSDLLRVERPDSYMRDLREDGGDLPYYNDDLFRGALKGVLDQPLEPGAILGPVVDAAGCYVVHVVRREPAPREAVDAELREQYRTRLPSAREVRGLEERLLDAAVIEPPLERD